MPHYGIALLGNNAIVTGNNVFNNSAAGLLVHNVPANHPAPGTASAKTRYSATAASASTWVRTG